MALNLVLKTKIYIPQVNRNIVSRERLLATLDEGLDQKLILVSASAGAGKTTLVCSWLRRLQVQSAKYRFAWLSLDHGENDLFQFIRYLIAALRTVQSDYGTGAVAILDSSQRLPLETILTSLLNDLVDLETDLYLVLDDYHLIQNQEVHQFVDAFLSSSPPQFHLLIATRVDPPLSLARMRGRLQLLEIRDQDLRFNQNETQDFFSQIMGLKLKKQDLDSLEMRTEGWVTGLQLAGLSLRNLEEPGAMIHSFAGSNRFIHNRSMAAVSSGQEARLREQLVCLGAVPQHVDDDRTGRKGCHILCNLSPGRVILLYRGPGYDGAAMDGYRREVRQGAMVGHTHDHPYRQFCGHVYSRQRAGGAAPTPCCGVPGTVRPAPGPPAAAATAYLYASAATAAVVRMP